MAQWTEQQVLTLKCMKREGASLDEIAAAVGKTKKAVSFKWTAIRYKRHKRARKAAMVGVWYGAGSRAVGEGRVVRSAPWSREIAGSLVGCATEMCTQVDTAVRSVYEAGR